MFASLRIQLQNGLRTLQSLQQDVGVLLLHEVVQKGNELSDGEGLTLYLQLLIDGFDSQNHLQHLLVGPLPDKPVDVFESNCEWFEFGKLGFLLLLLHHLNYIKLNQRNDSSHQRRKQQHHHPRSYPAPRRIAQGQNPKEAGS
jgi:hypothetical protein